jgi:diacylglycerol kinase (ATP)
MNRLKTQVIVNPESNQGRTGRRWSDIKEALRSFFQEFRCDFTEKPLQAIEIARSSIKEGNELIIGVGGDGTINEIANGFFENRRLINPASRLGILPSGTGSDLIKSLRIPAGWKEALKVITQASAARIDVGRTTFKDHAGQLSERFFLNVADFGLGGEVVRRVNDQRLARKTSSYLRCLVSAMVNYTSRRVRVTVDGRELGAENYLIGAVANGRVFGKGMKVAPQARMDDGLFDFVLVKGMRLVEFCRHGWKVFLGTHLSHPKISLLRGQRIEALSEEEKNVLLELDGEQVGTLPAAFEILPRQLSVIGHTGNAEVGP